MFSRQDSEEVSAGMTMDQTIRWWIKKSVKGWNNQLMDQIMRWWIKLSVDGSNNKMTD